MSSLTNEPKSSGTSKPLTTTSIDTRANPNCIRSQTPPSPLQPSLAPAASPNEPVLYSCGYDREFSAKPANPDDMVSRSSQPSVSSHRNRLAYPLPRCRYSSRHPQTIAEAATAAHAYGNSFKPKQSDLSSTQTSCGHTEPNQLQATYTLPHLERSSPKIGFLSGLGRVTSEDYEQMSAGSRIDTFKPACRTSNLPARQQMVTCSDEDDCFDLRGRTQNDSAAGTSESLDALANALGKVAMLGDERERRSRQKNPTTASGPQISPYSDIKSTYFSDLVRNSSGTKNPDFLPSDLGSPLAGSQTAPGPPMEVLAERQRRNSISHQLESTKLRQSDAEAEEPFLELIKARAQRDWNEKQDREAALHRKNRSGQLEARRVREEIAEKRKLEQQLLVKHRAAGLANRIQQLLLKQSSDEDSAKLKLDQLLLVQNLDNAKSRCKAAVELQNKQYLERLRARELVPDHMQSRFLAEQKEDEALAKQKDKKFADRIYADVLKANELKRQRILKTEQMLKAASLQIQRDKQAKQEAEEAVAFAKQKQVETLKAQKLEIQHAQAVLHRRMNLQRTAMQKQQENQQDVEPPSCMVKVIEQNRTRSTEERRAEKQQIENQQAEKIETQLRKRQESRDEREQLGAAMKVEAEDAIQNDWVEVEDWDHCGDDDDKDSFEDAIKIDWDEEDGDLQ